MGTQLRAPRDIPDATVALTWEHALGSIAGGSGGLPSAASFSMAWTNGRARWQLCWWSGPSLPPATWPGASASTSPAAAALRQADSPPAQRASEQRRELPPFPRAHRSAGSLRASWVPGAGEEGPRTHLNVLLIF